MTKLSYDHHVGYDSSTTTHFLLFVEDVKFVLDNASIRRTKPVIQAIKDKGHQPLFLPVVYLQFLNPIEECWAKIKNGVHSRKGRALNLRIQEAARRSPPKIVEAGFDIALSRSSASASTWRKTCSCFLKYTFILCCLFSHLPVFESTLRFL